MRQPQSAKEEIIYRICGMYGLENYDDFYFDANHIHFIKNNEIKASVTRESYTEIMNGTHTTQNHEGLPSNVRC